MQSFTFCKMTPIWQQFKRSNTDCDWNRRLSRKPYTERS